MRFLRSLFSWTVIVGATILFGIPSILAAFIPPRGDWYLLFARGWARTLLFATGVNVAVEGRENLDPSVSYVYFANHESFYDILVLMAYLPGQIRFLAKRGLFYLPVLGWSMAAAGFVAIDRADRRSAAASLDRAAGKLRGGKSLVLFPEQTRTKNGELLPFKKGGVLIALRTGHPILPVGLAGTFPILKKGSFFLTPGPAALEIGIPIPTAAKTVADREELLQASREAVLNLREKARKKL
ncbi:MAG: lysophospholipid acyltransferase family protein [Thermoanaerobaculia bacterium]